MEDIFKEKLQIAKEAKPNSFEELVLGEVLWAETDEEVSTPLSATSLDLSEKSVVMESFKNFAQEKVMTSPTGDFFFEGGMLKVKENSSGLWEPQAPHKAALFQSLALKLPTFFKSYLDKLTQVNESRVLIWTDSALPTPNIFTDSEVPPYLGFFFSAEVADLFFKMMKALKLSTDQYALFSVSELSKDEIWEVIHWLKPEIIITLGATPIKRVLESNEKLSLIHGKKQVLSVGNNQFAVIPLFHPTILVGNQNMKKTTWADMQEIIRLLHP